LPIQVTIFFLSGTAAGLFIAADTVNDCFAD